MTLRAKHIMHDRVAVASDASIRHAAYRMIATGLPGLPVINENREVAGIVTEFNILGAIREGFDLEKTPVARIMSKDPTTATINASTDDLIQMMLVDNFSILPIVNNNRYVGLVSRNAVMDACLSPEAYPFAEKETEIAAA